MRANSRSLGQVRPAVAVLVDDHVEVLEGEQNLEVSGSHFLCLCRGAVVGGALDGGGGRNGAHGWERIWRRGAGRGEVVGE